MEKAQKPETGQLLREQCLQREQLTACLTAHVVGPHQTSILLNQVGGVRRKLLCREANKDLPDGWEMDRSLI